MYAVIEDGLVVNLVLADAFFASQQGWVLATPGVSIGYSWSGAVFSPPVVDVSAARLEAIARIKAHRDLKTENGGYCAAGKWFHSDLISRFQQIGLILMGANIPADLQWKTMDGSFVTMTPTLAGQILAAAGAQDAALFAHAESLIGQINAADDPTAVDVAADWPATFGAA